MARKKYTYEIIEDFGDGHMQTVYVGDDVTEAADLFEKMTSRGSSMIWKQYFEKAE